MFARDSSVATPAGRVVTQLAQQWRRGEYAPVIRFYERNEIPIAGMITAGSIEGGDVTIVEPGCMLIGNGEERTQIQAAQQLAGWLEADGWEVRIEPIPGQFVHIDVLVSILAPKLAAVCVEAASGGLVAWLRGRGFEILEVSLEDAFKLGVNAISLGDDRVISTKASAGLNEQMRAHGPRGLRPRPLDVHDGRRRGPLPRPGAAPRSRVERRPVDRRRPRDRRPARARRAHRRRVGRAAGVLDARPGATRDPS